MREHIKHRTLLFISFLISALGLFVVLEIGIGYWLKATLKRELPIEALRQMREGVSYFHHHRTVSRWFNGKDGGSLVFEEIRKGEQKILVQGDSWAEGMEIDTSTIYSVPYHSGNSVFFLALDKRLSNFGYINAGTGSYAPSLESGQLRWLKLKYGFDPTYIILYVDQTDLGDEIFKYSKLVKRKDGLIIDVAEDDHYQYKSQYQALIDFNDSVLKTYGLYKYLQTKSDIKKRENNDLFSRSSLDALEIDLAPEQIEIFKTEIAGYIKEALSGSKIQKLILISHPHRRHLEGDKRYKNNVFDYINEVYKDLPVDQKQKVCLGYIEPKYFYRFSSYDDVFKSKDVDPFSHLKPEFQANQFPQAIARITNNCIYSEQVYK